MIVDDFNRKPYPARTIYMIELEANDLILIRE